MLFEVSLRSLIYDADKFANIAVGMNGADLLAVGLLYLWFLNDMKCSVKMNPDYIHIKQQNNFICIFFFNCLKYRIFSILEE